MINWAAVIRLTLYIVLLSYVTITVNIIDPAAYCKQKNAQT